MLFRRQIKFSNLALSVGVGLCAIFLLWMPNAWGQSQVGQVRMLIQESALAGSQFHTLDAHWERIAIGDELTLRREPDNRHDPKAIRVEWQGFLLGYVPRRENRAVSAAMDEGDELVAKVIALRTHRNPWLRLRFSVYSVL